MQNPIEYRLDVTLAAGLGMQAHVAVTVFLPDDGQLANPPVICFGFPGGGYCRQYYALDMPDGQGSQARFHCDRGWIFVACDHLGFGQSTVPDGDALTLDNVAAANDAAVRHIMQMTAAGTLAGGLQPVGNATALGIGQSMGGCFTIVQQGQFATFDGVGILGFSGIHTVVPTRPGAPPFAWPWLSRGSTARAPRVLKAGEPGAPALQSEHPYRWAFHYDDVPAEIVSSDMDAAAGTAPILPSWRSPTTPACGRQMVAPGVVAQEAAAISVPVLIALGERDVAPDPAAEPKAYGSASDITIFICPRMGHMHNFALTRTLFWQRIHLWGEAVACLRVGICL